MAWTGARAICAAILLLSVNVNVKAENDSSKFPIDDSKTAELLRGSEEAINLNTTVNTDTEEQGYKIDKLTTTTETEESTTVFDLDALKSLDDTLKSLDDERTYDNVNDAENVKVDSDDTTDANDIIETTVYNNIDRTKNAPVEDIYSGASTSGNSLSNEATTTTETVNSIDAMDAQALTRAETPKEQPNQRNAKTENSADQPISKPEPEARPLPPPTVSKSSALKSWLEDTWLRPPAGILVPLRPMALHRALAVWNDLTAERLNLTDIVIIGFDSNGVAWRSRHNLQMSSTGRGHNTVTEALSKLLMKYQDVRSDTEADGTIKALTTAAKLVPYDSALFVVTDQGPGDPQKMPLALRALVEKRLKVYTIWTNPEPSSVESAALHELKSISSLTEGQVLPYSMKVMEMEEPKLTKAEELRQWDPINSDVTRQSRVNAYMENDNYDTLLIRRGGGEALSLGIPVENGVTALKILIEGAVEHAVFYPPNDAPQIDLYNQTSVQAFSVSSRTLSLSPRDVSLVFPGARPDGDQLSVLPMTIGTTEAASPASMVGSWHLSVRCDTCDYRLCLRARSQIHLQAEQSRDKLKLRITGPVASVRETVLVDEYGNEQAKLPFSYQPVAGDGSSSPDSPITELVTSVPMPKIEANKVYAKIVGRDIRGEPFIRYSGPLNHGSERISRSATLVFPDTVNDLDQVEMENSRQFHGRLLYNDSNVLPYNRATSQVINQGGTILTSVQIGLSTKLYGAPGETIQLHFEVTNYRDQTVRFSFEAVGELKFLRDINPRSQSVASGQTVNVVVTAVITNTAQPGARDLVTFTAYGLDQVSISSYIYVLNPGVVQSDVWYPEVRHTFQGSCIGKLGDDCARNTWSTTVFARDNIGGILRLSSSPTGLIYDSNFIAGTREEIVASYRATCCTPRVLVTAVDAYGNTNSHVIDISNYFTSAGIAAIVLGVFLLLAIILLIAFLIWWCIRRRREKRDLPTFSSSSRNIN